MSEKRDPIPPAAVIALRNELRRLRYYWMKIPNAGESQTRVVMLVDVERAIDAARVEPPPQEQDCGLSANDIYHVMRAWEKEPASEEQTRIVIGLGKLRGQFIQRGDSPYVTDVLAAHRAPPTQEPTSSR